MKTKTLKSDGLGNLGMTLRAYAEQQGQSLSFAKRMARAGFITGARLHPLTRQWWVYPPETLLCEKLRSYVDTSRLMISTLPDGVQA
ncbi:MAG: hypothetical protein U1E13_14265 [Methylophilaceae bacterium]|nr:hypothetical protein [Methylophilaceae bacterium]